jgi:hypothetical protein
MITVRALLATDVFMDARNKCGHDTRGAVCKDGLSASFPKEIA